MRILNVAQRTEIFCSLFEQPDKGKANNNNNKIFFIYNYN
ncbi:hypothetical protein HMPREF9012_1391 [Bacteroidetes bacterium oral taxon 272 str. F0290]|nr:hypothetical protein HMPREF9012_1391 [Bacteroidetes bacterium oral taxon 272 str. F0290]